MAADVGVNIIQYNQTLLHIDGILTRTRRVGSEFESDARKSASLLCMTNPPLES